MAKEVLVSPGQIAQAESWMSVVGQEVRYQIIILSPNNPDAEVNKAIGILTFIPPELSKHGLKEGSLAPSGSTLATIIVEITDEVWPIEQIKQRLIDDGADEGFAEALLSSASTQEPFLIIVNDDTIIS